MKAILIGVLSAVFFSATFILNRAMELDGGSWVWSASLRFYFMLMMLLIIVGGQRKVKPVLIHMRKQPLPWLIWSTVGFGLFYAPLTFATIYGPGWLVAATFQITTIAGPLLVPFLTKHNQARMPVQSIFISLFIIAGVFIMQAEHATSVPLSSVLLSIIPLLIAAFSYPLGNRKMMEVVNGELNTFQRILGMTIASMPFWFILSIYGVFEYGLPSSGQVTQTFLVALFSGIIATTLFFYATELVRTDHHKLAGVEATQACVVMFALLGELLLLDVVAPSYISYIGIGFVVVGMILHSVVSSLVDRKTKLKVKEINIAK